MALVLNALDRENKAMCGGNEFSFKPKQVKHFYNEDIAHFLTTRREANGLIMVPKEFDDPERPEIRQSEEYKAVIADLTARAIDEYCAHLNRLVNNEQVGLLKDLRKNNDPSDPRYLIHPNMVKNMEELVQYRTKKEDAGQVKVDRIKELEKALAKG